MICMRHYFGINTTCDISKLSQISLMVLKPNIATNHAILYTNNNLKCVNYLKIYFVF